MICDHFSIEEMLFSWVDLLHHENAWLDTLQNKIYATAHTGADAEETSEELDVNLKEICSMKICFSNFF